MAILGQETLSGGQYSSEMSLFCYRSYI